MSIQSNNFKIYIYIGYLSLRCDNNIKITQHIHCLSEYNYYTYNNNAQCCLVDVRFVTKYTAAVLNSRAGQPAAADKALKPRVLHTPTDRTENNPNADFILGRYISAYT